MRAAAVSHPWTEPPGPGQAVEIAEGVLWARLPLPFRPDHLNAYVLDDGDGWTLVDTGLDTAAVREAWARNWVRVGNSFKLGMCGASRRVGNENGVYRARVYRSNEGLWRPCGV